MKHLDLFSGIGGFALAARWMGWETIGLCDNDDFARQILAKHWPGVPLWDDIEEITVQFDCDIITGGFPCQPWSLAGRQMGAEDDRHLWPEMLRVVALQKPSWVVCENVPGLIGVGLDEVLSDLEDEGYTALTFVVPAVAVGAHHRRDRVWVVANAGGGRFGAEKGREVEQSGRTQVERAGETASRAVGEERRLPEPGMGGTPHGVSSWLDGSWESGVPRTAPANQWTRERIHALGNAVVPQVAYRIFQAIAKSNL